MSPIGDKKINCLLIHADQHRADCLGASGNPDIRTPHIDTLAAQGIRYDNSFCPYPVCTPSRYSMLSGQYVHEHQGWDNHCTLAPDIPTFPRLLRDAGYTTHAVGKMHFTPTYLDVGFEQMTLVEQDGPGRWDDDYHRALMAAGLVDVNDLEDQRREYRQKARSAYWDTFGALPSNLPEAWHSTTWIGNHAVDALEGWNGGGHLLMTGFVKPHHPFDPPSNRSESYDAKNLTLLPGWTPACLPHDLDVHGGYFPHEDLDEPTLRRVMAYYYATIEHIDAQVGRMISVLKRKGLYDNTLILYTSDHGEYMGFHHLLLKGNHLYDPLVKVPLIIKYPAGSAVTPGVSTALVSNIDVAQTILGQAGITPAASMQGIDLATNGAGHDVVFCELLRGNLVMARTHTRKLILGGEAGRVLLYDLEKDPCEMDSRAHDYNYRNDLMALTRAIEQWRPATIQTVPFLDENAPVIPQSNVPPRNNVHRPAIMDWYTSQMNAYKA